MEGEKKILTVYCIVVFVFTSLRFGPSGVDGFPVWDNVTHNANATIQHTTTTATTETTTTKKAATTTTNTSASLTAAPPLKLTPTPATVKRTVLTRLINETNPTTNVREERGNHSTDLLRSRDTVTETANTTRAGNVTNYIFVDTNSALATTTTTTTTTATTTTTTTTTTLFFRQNDYFQPRRRSTCGFTH